MKIGLVGEAPTDTGSVENILKKKYSDFEYIPLIKNINGSLLDNQKTKRILRIEYEIQKPDIIIFIRDLDSLKSDKIQLSKRKKYFSENNRVVDKKGIYLLNIFEIEALLLTDLQSFHNYYGDSSEQIFEIKDVSEIVQPKEYLKEINGKYIETHNSKIFETYKLSVFLHCRYFKSFFKRFENFIISIN